MSRRRTANSWSSGPASSDAIYAQGYKNLVSATQIAASLLGHPSVKAMNEIGIKKVAFIYLDEPFPAGITKGAAELAENLGMEVTMMEKFAKGTKDFSIMTPERQRASGAEAFYPTGYEGDQMVIARQLREMNIDFPMTYMVYASQPQFLEVGSDADFLYSQTLYHEKINWKVTDGLDRAAMEARYNELFPDAAYPPDFQTALAYGAGAVFERIVSAAQSLEPAKLKETAVGLSGEIVVLTGPYEIDETGKQTKMEFIIMQNQKSGPEVIYPAAVKTAEPIFPAPGYGER